jgi:gamma-glutamyltranspeptidase/glutathione hydrolase
MRLFSLLLIAGLVLACTPPASGPSAAGPSGTIALPFEWEFRGVGPIGTGTQGVVSTTEVRATRVGIDVLQAGGNAVDAVIAAAFALAVVYPQAGNIGGGGFAVVRLADGETAALDFREAAPLALRADDYQDAEGRPTDASRIGHLASGVPGTVAGLAELHRRFGTQRWQSLIAPAVDLAENGFTVEPRFFQSLSSAAGKLRQFEGTDQVFFVGGEPPRVGSTFRQPMLAETLRLIASDGEDAFYRGRIADMIVEEMRVGDGLISLEDMGDYEAKWREPISFEYRGHTVISMPPPSSGGITLAEILNILEGYDLGQLGFNTPESLHLVAEAFRRAFADRNYYLGDPDFVSMPVARLISDEYAAEQRASISRSRASSSASFNKVPVLSEGSNTTHISIVDGQGNAAALTYTLNSTFGSGVVVERAGFLLNNEMDDFTVRAGYPNQFGLIQGEANLVGPERRPLSAMTPTIVLDPQGQLRLVVGSPGGPKIITAVAQVIINVIDHGMDVRAAVDAPRIHHQLLPDQISVEDHGIDGPTSQTLSAFGHRLSLMAGYFGDVQLIIIEPGGMLYGAADPRNDGRALGY